MFNSRGNLLETAVPMQMDSIMVRGIEPTFMVWQLPGKGEIK